MNTLMLGVSFVISLVCTLLLIRYKRLHKHTSDSDLIGVQKFHTKAVPRIGGVGVFCGAVGAAAVGYIFNQDGAVFGLLVFISSFFSFAAGLLEDITKKVGVRERLFATALSGLFGCLILNEWLNRSNIDWLDVYVLSLPIVAIPLTCLAISGVANAYNIIDGYNGLSSVVAIFVLFGLAKVANQVGDSQIVMISLVMVGAVSGFLVWNFPRGLIFLGDGGAYFIGFMVAQLSVLLVSRNQQVSPWFPLLLTFYPIFETVFSIYRKKYKRGMSPGVPDGLHLHMLIYKRVVRWAGGGSSVKQQTTRNALTSPYLWVLSSFAVFPSVLFWDNTPMLIACIVLFSLGYVYVYRSIVRAKVPNWIVLRKP